MRPFPPPPQDPHQKQVFQRVGLGCAWLIIGGVILLCAAFLVWALRVLL